MKKKRNKLLLLIMVLVLTLQVLLPNLTNIVRAATVKAVTPNVTGTIVNVGQGSHLYIRKQPAADATIITKYVDGTKLTITGGTDDGWLQVKLSDGTTGYGSAAYINVSVSGVTLTAKSSVTIGKTVQLTETITPWVATKQSVTWSSSDNKVATVSSKGVVTGVSPGTATITVKTEDGGKTDTCKVTVDPIAVTGVSVKPATASITVGQTTVLTATISPSTATNQSVTWSSSNTSIATVSSKGVVTAVTAGTATITAKTEDGGKTASCSVTVKPILVTSISMVATKSIYLGSTTKLTATVQPNNAGNKTLQWLSSNTEIVTVNSQGSVTAVAEGTATITAKATDSSNITAKCIVTVIDQTVSVTGIQVTPSTVSIMPDDTMYLTADISPLDATNTDVTWVSSNPAIATVDEDGQVQGVIPGTVTITATSDDGHFTSQCTVTVNPIPVSSVTLDGTLALVAGDTGQLMATINPENATNRAVIWTSNNSSVVSIDGQGKIKANAVGKAVITVTTVDGKKTATCTVTVSAKVIEVTSISLLKSVKINTGATYKLVATISPTNATNKTVVWSSSNAAVATVNAQGVVSSIKAGMATITAKSVNGKTAACTVTVSDIAVTSLSVNKTSIQLMAGETFKLVSKILPANATNKTVTFTSGKKNIATVDKNGIITAKASGTAVITGKTNNGKTATCTVKVMASTLKLTGKKTSIPSNLIKGKGVPVEGMIESNYKIGEVKVGIMKSSGKWVKGYPILKAPKQTSYDLQKTDKLIKFNELKAGSYKFIVIASDTVITKTLQSTAFKVTKPSTLGLTGKKTSIPEQLTKGVGVSVQGTIKSNYKIKNVQVGIKIKSKTTKKWGWIKGYPESKAPNAKTFDLYSVDSLIKFNTLAEGEYRFVVKATDEMKTKTLQSTKFKVVKSGGTSGGSGSIGNVKSNDQQIQKILNNIQNSSNIPSNKKVTCAETAKALLEQGFPPAFVAGMLANICHEGNTGYFESSAYISNPGIEPDYLQNMDKYYNYRNEYSQQLIYHKNLDTVYDMLATFKKNKWTKNGKRIGFGLGSIQWTFERTYNLVVKYREVCGGKSTITELQTIQAEAKLVTDELGNFYEEIYDDWESNNKSNLNSQNAAYNAGYNLCYKYEIPHDTQTQAVKRGNLAKPIYADMVK